MIVIMKSRILLFLGLLSCIGLQMFAQVSVSGKVVDAGGIEMPGVNIAIKGTMVGTMTGADGTFIKYSRWKRCRIGFFVYRF